MTFSEDCQTCTGISLAIDDEDKTDELGGASGFLNQGVTDFNHDTAFFAYGSVIATPTKSINIVSVAWVEVMAGRGGSQTWTSRIMNGVTQIGFDVTSTFNTVSRNQTLTNLGQETNAGVAPQTYDGESKSSAANQIAYALGAINAVVIKG